MAGYCRVILLGTLGKDPEQRSFQNGGSVVNMSIATSETWKDKSGERQEKTEWHKVCIFNEKLGEVAMSYLAKGSRVLIEGTIQTRKWEKDGVTQYSTEVVVPKFGGLLQLIDKKQEAGAGDGSRKAERRQESTGNRRSTAPIDDDEVPF